MASRRGGKFILNICPYVRVSYTPKQTNAEGENPEVHRKRKGSGRQRQTLETPAAWPQTLLNSVCTLRKCRMLKCLGSGGEWRFVVLIKYQHVICVKGNFMLLLSNKNTRYYSILPYCLSQRLIATSKSNRLRGSPCLLPRRRGALPDL